MKGRGLAEHNGYALIRQLNGNWEYKNPKLDTRISFFVLLRHAQGTPPGF